MPSNLGTANAGEKLGTANAGEKLGMDSAGEKLGTANAIGREFFFKKIKKKC